MTAANAVFVIVVIVRHELFLLVGRPPIGPDKSKIDGASELFPHEGSRTKNITLEFPRDHTPTDPSPHSAHLGEGSAVPLSLGAGERQGSHSPDQPISISTEMFGD